MTSPFTGRHMAGILVAFFGTVIAVNAYMASAAVGSFGGVVVENSYVASQAFNSWLREAEASRALGWEAVTTWRPDDRLLVTVRGAPAGLSVAATARHPLGRLPDRELTFAAIDANRYLSNERLAAGRWTLRLELTGGADRWRREEALR